MARSRAHSDAPTTHGDATPNEITLPCVSCGYDLRELPPGGACPECGTSIDRSRRAVRLALADAGWLRTISRGQSVFAIGMVVAICGIVAGVGLPLVIGFGGAVLRADHPVLVDVAAFAARGLILSGIVAATIGASLLTVQEPRERLREGTWSTRRLARGGLLGALAVIVLEMLLDRYLTGLLHQVQEYAGLLLFALAVTVALVAVLTRLARLAERIPDHPRARRARELAESFHYAIPLVAACMVLIGAGNDLAAAVPLPEIVIILVTAGASLLGLGLLILLLVQFVRTAQLMLALRRAFAACVDESRPRGP